ncbi:hypothetical protein [uncultured Bradyrhizobium sp.]|uniref:hypothetical protein n=1 Tax=uncultured Bradyrhizobium sp. TaxID=199684 RepID=UPI0035C9F6DE
MQTFKTAAAQGEITIRRVGDVPAKRALPSGYSNMKPEHGKFIIGHSETGHHHVLERTTGVDIAVMDKAPAGMKILRAILETPNSLIHLREHDTHQTIQLLPGEYEFRIAREFDHYAELARQSAD